MMPNNWNPEWGKIHREKNRDIIKQKKAAYYQKNKDRIAVERKEKHAANPDKARARAKAWMKAHPERAKARTQKWISENQERHNEKSRRRAANNRVKHNEQANEWRKKHPEVSRAACHRRRARINGSNEHYDYRQLEELRAKSKGKCAICKIKAKLTIDHIMPLAKGGSNAIRNIQFLCHPCNSGKRDRDPLEFARKHGLLC